MTEAFSESAKQQPSDPWYVVTWAGDVPGKTSPKRFSKTQAREAMEFAQGLPVESKARLLKIQQVWEA